MKRRHFLGLIGAGSLGMLPFAEAWADGLPSSLLGANPLWIPTNPPRNTVPTNVGARGRVVVVGGGMAGATVAKYLRLWGGVDLQVTLVEREATYVSNIMSNLVLNKVLDMGSLSFNWNRLVANYGVRLVRGEVLGIDSVGKQVMLAGGARLPYDRLVIAPGIEFDTVPGLETDAARALVPHAWKAGAQTTALRDRITAMRAGGVFVMSIPKAPYRCPPGPYERACVVADYLKRTKPGSKVIVLDENAGIIAEKENFSFAFNFTHSGVIDYRPSTTVVSVDAPRGRIYTSNGTVDGDVLNVIPNQRAGALLTGTGLLNVGNRWAGVDVLTYESTAIPSVHILGDSAATTQPKAGHIANQEAKVCADAIVRTFLGMPPDQAPVTNSACYSPVTASTASWLTAVYNYDSATRTMKVVANMPAEAKGATTENMMQMRQWFSNLMTDSFA